MAKDTAEELGIEPKMELKAFAYAGVKPEIMGIGPIPATHKALKVAGLSIEDIGLIELNEAFAVQAIAFMNEFGLKFPDEPRMNIYGGAIAFGHPLASSGCRLALHLMHGFAEHPEVKYGLTTLCVGLGQGARQSGRIFNATTRKNKRTKRNPKKRKTRKRTKRRKSISSSYASDMRLK